MAKNINYDSYYYQQRDHLDLLIAQSLKIKIEKSRLTRILDVGCGTGRLVKFFNNNGYQSKGCDNVAKAVEFARKINRKGTINKAPADKLPYKNASFDLVTSISVIEHLTPKESGLFLSESRRVLEKGGQIFLVTPNFNSPFRYLLGKRWFAYTDPTHINFYTRSSLAKALSRAGFKQTKFRHESAYNVPFDWYLPAKLRNLPMPLKNTLNYLLISSPLSNYRDSIWVSARK